MAQASDMPAGRLVSDNPADFTPHVLDGRVFSVVQVGDTIILGGTFSKTRDNDNQTVINRASLVAFNANTGRISTTFVPNPNGTVNVVLPTGDGQTVYIGGTFTTVKGQSASKLAKVRISDGSLVTSFNGGSPTGTVKDLRLSDGHLWVAGAFTHIQGKHQPALATLNPITGAFDPYMAGLIEGVHNGGYTTVMKIDVNPANSRLIAMGNFDTLNGVKNHQLFMLDTTGATAAQANFQTNFYTSGCSASFDSYMRDLDFSPDGSFFVVSTTGAYGGSSGACDETARWATNETGNDLQPSWVNYTGGDTTYAVEVTDSAVYVGGHQRWQNNPFAGDSPGPGAVARPGIAALHPQNGLPYSWNPTRTRGVGVFDLLNTSQGLWVTSDTDRIGAYEYHARVALMPAAGEELPALKTPALPNDVYSAGALGSASDPSILYRVNAAGNELSAASGMDWSPDTADNSSAYRNTGNRASYPTVGSVDQTVPAGTPRDMFSTELWDEAAAPEMHWGFPVPAGTPTQVRLYFANRCSCTSQVGRRAFDVSIDGTKVLDNFDIVASAGDNVGTMRKFDVSSDGTLDIDFSHITENPLVNGIEIIRTDIPAGSPNSGGIVKHTYNAGTVGPAMPVPDGGLNWNTSRGAFMINGYLYTAWSDGTFTRRAFNGSTYGASQAVNTQDEIAELADWHTDASQASGMFYDNGRLYFTRTGSSTLYFRYFNPESGVIGAKRFEASGNVSGIDFSRVRGMFSTGSQLFSATPDGNLHRIDWSQGPQSGAAVAGTDTIVSGPATDGNNFASRVLFLYQNSDGDGAAATPTASFVSSCNGVSCDFDASSSTAPGTSIASYAWDFGDGHTRSGMRTSHDYAGSDTYTVRLTITTSKAGSDTTSRQVVVSKKNQPPTASFTFNCNELACSFDAGGSTDPDGTIASYVWSFGDGMSGNGKTVTHTYEAAGSQDVTLTVTDGENATDAKTTTIDVSATPAAAIDYVASQSSNGNRVKHVVTVPSGVHTGDTLVLFLTTNSDAMITVPSGWSQLEAVDAGGFRARAWTKTATASDAGATVTAMTSAYAKSTMTVTTYRSTSASSAVAVSASDSKSGSATTLRTPAVMVTQPGSWLISYWGVKSAAVPVPTDVGSTTRSTSEGSGGGRTDALLIDSDGGVPTGDAGGLTATVSDASSRAAMFSVVLQTN